jgi:hypothetical protein
VKQEGARTLRAVVDKVDRERGGGRGGDESESEGSEGLHVDEKDVGIEEMGMQENEWVIKDNANEKGKRGRERKEKARAPD